VILDHVNSIPPFVCVAVARVGHRRKTLREISRDSGLSYRKVERIGRRLSWGSVKLSDADAFSRACGVNLLCQEDVRRYLKRQSGVKNVLSHLSKQELERFIHRMALSKAPQG